MKEKHEKIIEKMLKYAMDSLKYLPKDYDSFVSDEKVVVFAVFSLSQLGELVTKLDKSFRDAHDDIEWKSIKGLRDRIVHDYEGVKTIIVWNILTKDIPLLIEKLHKLLRELQRRID